MRILTVSVTDRVMSERPVRDRGAVARVFKAARLGSLGGLYDRPGKSPQATMVTDGVRDVVVLYLNRPDNFPTCRDRHRLG